MEEKFETYKHQYLNGELSISELKKELTTEDFNEFISIITITNQFETENLSIKEAYKDALNKRQSNKSKVIQLWKKLGSIAAVFLLLVTVGYFAMNQTKEKNPQSIEIVSLTNEVKTVSLPDGSEVLLNAQSKISYSEETWSKNRIIHLEGEAFFKVEKGSRFSVKHNNGSVTVLGTQFNVNTRNQSFKVQCYEGKVQVKYANKEYILTKGESFNSMIFNPSGNFVLENNQSPNWVAGKTVFDGETLETVVKDILLYYDVNLTLDKNVNQQIPFSGVYYHKDSIETTLKSICTALNLTFQQTKNKEYVIMNP